MYDSKSITEWVHEVHQLARRKGWYEGQTGPDDMLEPSRIPEKLALIHSEVSEALEAFRSDDMAARVGENGKPEGFAVELADVVIRCFDLAGALGINLEAAIHVKHEYNCTRPHRHGGKRC
jgi:NTP pyrophosphatase (non-canonical NTP hydrolase)